MKVAYILNSPNAANYKVGAMILPQLESDSHGVDVLGIFFFDDNAFMLRAGDPKGERLAKIAKEKGMLLMMCDQCAIQRGLATGEAGNAEPVGVVDGVAVGCFPDLYAALGPNPPDQVISL
ncbi:MAG: SaoD/DsrE family protein [Chloroflexota bacterium]|nr:SaoD/DsrE family protein [Chloroflexota bacterium]